VNVSIINVNTIPNVVIIDIIAQISKNFGIELSVNFKNDLFEWFSAISSLTDLLFELISIPLIQVNIAAGGTQISPTPYQLFIYKGYLALLITSAFSS